ncbi:MAG: phosphoenolpyruvate carboxykinase (ATP) [Gemmatimonadetes bacterium]|nr:phosphoenolpyruvate carboxykinase (ATP) [Gemmatimonadota bacterium]
MATKTVTAEVAASGPSASGFGLENHGLRPTQPVHWNLSPAELCERALVRGEGKLSRCGAFTAVTAPHTGRSPKDRFVVREASSADRIHWGAVNVPMEEDHYSRLRAHVIDYLNRSELFVRDMWAGTDPRYRIGVRVVSASAWHSLFTYNMFVRPTPAELQAMRPDFTVLHAPELETDPTRHGTRSATGIVLHLGEREVLVAASRYAGEIKKSIFSVLNYLLPRRGVLSMHCSANVGPDGDSALFFGLSGTGKTTLSADATRGLIGDDEHGWSDEGIFNFEGGCYAKVIRLSPQAEPEIFHASQRFGTVLENVILDPVTRDPDWDDDSITENTRSSYPIDYIPNAVVSGRAGHPKNILFLTADAFGVMPPISRLTPEQAMYHFLSGYTAKVAGTERGLTEPVATFSMCFGAPFLPLKPSVYADLLGRKMRGHGVACWLVNTGWTGGPYGVGRRMKLEYTRAMIRAVLAGTLQSAEFEREPVFGLLIPESAPHVPADVLKPRSTWPDAKDYDARAAKLAGMFKQNFEQFAGDVTAAVRDAGPE